VAQPDPSDLIPQQSRPSITIPKEQWERINKELKTLRENAKCVGFEAADPDEASGPGKCRKRGHTCVECPNT